MPETRRPHTRGRFVLCATLAIAAQTATASTAYVTTEKEGVAVIDLDQMSVTKTIPLGEDGPRGLSLTADGAHLLVANKNTGDLAVINTQSGAVMRRVKIGKNPEFVRVSGDFAYVTHEPGDSSGAPARKGADDDSDAHKPSAQIALVDLKNFRVTRTIVSGHETEGIEFSRDGKTLLVTNEGDDTVSTYDSRNGAPLKTIKLISGGRPRGIRAAPDGKSYVVTLESASKFVVLDAGDYRVIKTVDTKLGPYGVSYDPSGQRLFIAASRDSVIQVFDARTYAHLADVPVGQRCWHFSFTPDGGKLLVACGRSNAVYVVDTHSYHTMKEVTGLPLAWGIVTYPRSSGSIESR